MRGRVHTISVPVVSELHQLYAAADEGAIATLLAKLAVEKSYVAKLDDTRQVRYVYLDVVLPHICRSERGNWKGINRWAERHVKGVKESS